MAATNTGYTDDELMAFAGGRTLVRGGARTWWFGMNPSDPAATAAVVTPHDPAEAVPADARDRVTLYTLPWLANGRKHPPYNWQLTGSCVNGGANNALMVLIAKKLLRDGAAGRFVTPFTLPAYGASRAGMFGPNRQGDGSGGDEMAQALRDFGYCPFDLSGVGLPAPKLLGAAYCYTEQVEYFYSALNNCPAAVRAACRKNKLAYISVSTPDELEAEIRRWRPATVAGNWGGRTQGLAYKGSGPNRILWNGDQVTNWEHQQAILGVWRHPEFGRLWYWQNQWFFLNGGAAAAVHGAAATDEPPGGYWTDDRAVQHQFDYRHGEIRVFADDTPFDPAVLGHLAV